MSSFIALCSVLNINVSFLCFGSMEAGWKNADIIIFCFHNRNDVSVLSIVCH